MAAKIDVVNGAQYLVMDLTHDPYAEAAALSYADRCEIEHPDLASRLRDAVGSDECVMIPRAAPSKISFCEYVAMPLVDPMLQAPVAEEFQKIWVDVGEMTRVKFANGKRLKIVRERA